MTLNELFKNTTYDDTLFSVEDKSTIESRIFMKSVRGSEVPYITCAIRDKEIKLTPEEAVSALYLQTDERLWICSQPHSAGNSNSLWP